MSDAPEAQAQDAQAFELLASLPTAENYTEKDRYRDFRRVLLGTDEGKRVLRQLLAWMHFLRPTLFGSPIDPYAMAVLGAEHNLALRLIKTLTVEPKEQPTTQTKRT